MAALARLRKTETEIRVATVIAAIVTVSIARISLIAVIVAAALVFGRCDNRRRGYLMVIVTVTIITVIFFFFSGFLWRVGKVGIGNRGAIADDDRIIVAGILMPGGHVYFLNTIGAVCQTAEGIIAVCVGNCAHEYRIVVCRSPPAGPLVEINGKAGNARLAGI